MKGVRIERGILEYTKYGQTFYRVDIWLEHHNGSKHRVQRSSIPTLDLARHVVNKLRADAFEGRYFERQEGASLTVEKLWEQYKPVSKRENSHRTYDRNLSLAAHLVEHLGSTKIGQLNLDHVDTYREKRGGESTKRKTPPTPATVNREISLLRRMLNFAVSYKKLKSNPLREVVMVPENNVREVVVTEAEFSKVLAHADKHLYPILITAYDTGLRKGTVLNLQWSQVDLSNKTIRVGTTDSTTKRQPPLLKMTDRLHEALKVLPRSISGYVFVNPKTDKPWVNIRKKWKKALKAAEMDGTWVHDLRRSFCTNARRWDVPESVAMKMSGHKTRSVFERYNIVDDSDMEEAIHRMENGRRNELAKAKGQ